MKILITGATGFVGSHLAEKLIKEGHDVYCLARSLKKTKPYLFLTNIIIGSLHYNKAPSWIKKLPDDLNLVIHTAGIVHSHQAKNFHNTNDKATQILFQALIKKYKKLHFTYISSLASCGPNQNKIKHTEESDQSPISEYGISKYNSEIYLQENLPKNYTLSIIRPPMVIGPRDPAVLDIFKMVKNRLIITPGVNGRNKEYSFVCVFDLIDVITKASFSRRSPVEIYFASYPKSIKYSELVDSISRLMGNKKILYIGVPSLCIKAIGHLLSFSDHIVSNELRLTKDKTFELIPDSWTCDATRSEEELNHKYKWNLEKTLKITYDDYIKSGNL